MAHLAFGREGLGDGIGELVKRHPVDPGENEGAQLGVRVDLRGAARAVRAAVIGRRGIAFKGGLKGDFNKALNGPFKGSAGLDVGSAGGVQQLPGLPYGGAGGVEVRRRVDQSFSHFRTLVSDARSVRAICAELFPSALR